MKRLCAPQRRRPLDSALPMINLVFLLLAFFIASAVVAPPHPLKTEPPTAAGAEPQEAASVVHLDADGVVAWRDHRDAAAFAALEAHFSDKMDTTLSLRADARTSAATLTAALDRLRAVGATTLFLTVRRAAPETETAR